LVQSDSIIGNINSDRKLMEKYEEMRKRGLVEGVAITRFESSRVRMRKTSDKGTDLLLTLPVGTHLRRGDVVFLSETKMIVIEMEPESVATIEISHNLHEDELVELAVKVGHSLGNLHRPLIAEGHRVYIPIQGDSELEMLNNLFRKYAGSIEIKKKVMIFEPEEETKTHEH